MSKQYTAYFIGGQQDLSKRVVSKPLQQIEFAASETYHDETQFFTESYLLHSVLSGGRESCLIYVFEGALGNSPPEKVVKMQTQTVRVSE